jgi:redox-sensitive bicupin YhaK (pirin superfamily)
MLQIRKSEERGIADHGWLQAKHSFSFGNYRDPLHQSFGPLLVINEDRIAPGKGFGTHSHRDMEIITYVINGALEHKDSMGTGSVLHYGDVQRMSAGSGVQHSEFNHSATNGLHLLQIWIAPNVEGIPPSYEEIHVDTATKTGQLRLIASSDGRNGSVTIHQDAALYAAILDGETVLEHALAPQRLGYVQVVHGTLQVNGVVLRAGDALKIADERCVVLTEAQAAEILLFDLPH